MKAKQRSIISPQILTISLIVLVASALLATLLIASLVYSARRDNEAIATLRTEVEDLRQEQKLTQRELAALADEVGSLEKTVSSQVTNDVVALGTDIKALRQDQMAISSEIESLASEIKSLKEARLKEKTSSAEESIPSEPAPSVPEEELTGPSTEVKLDVPRYKQAHSLSCESSAASMVSNFYGVSLSEEEVIEALPRDENPNLGFRGRLDGPPGGLTDYGVYADPIAEILAANGLEATYVEDGLEGMKKALDRGHPVIAWVTYELRVQKPVEITLSTGQKVKMVNYEHTVVVTGYNQEGFWVNDPYDGQEHFYKSTDFARAFGYLDNMALEVAPNSGL